MSENAKQLIIAAARSCERFARSAHDAEQASQTHRGAFLARWHRENAESESFLAFRVSGWER